MQHLELQLFGQRLARLGGLGGIAIQEHEAGREPGRQREACLCGDGAQESGRLFDQQTAAIPGLAVRRDRATMREPIQ